MLHYCSEVLFTWMQIPQNYIFNVTENFSNRVCCRGRIFRNRKNGIGFLTASFVFINFWGGNWRHLPHIVYVTICYSEFVKIDCNKSLRLLFDFSANLLSFQSLSFKSFSVIAFFMYGFHFRGFSLFPPWRPVVHIFGPSFCGPVKYHRQAH